LRWHQNPKVYDQDRRKGVCISFMLGKIEVRFV